MTISLERVVRSTSCVILGAKLIVAAVVCGLVGQVFKSVVQCVLELETRLLYKQSPRRALVRAR